MLVLVDKITKTLQARHSVKVEAEDNVGTTHSLRSTSLSVVLIVYYALTVRHKVEVVGVFIGHNTIDPMSLLTKNLGPRQR